MFARAISVRANQNKIFDWQFRPNNREGPKETKKNVTCRQQQQKTPTTAATTTPKIAIATATAATTITTKAATNKKFNSLNHLSK